MALVRQARRADRTARAAPSGASAPAQARPLAPERAAGAAAPGSAASPVATGAARPEAHAPIPPPPARAKPQPAPTGTRAEPPAKLRASEPAPHGVRGAPAPALPGRAAKSPCTNSPGPGAARAATGAGERSCGTVGNTPCIRTRRAWTAQRPAAGSSGGAARSPCTNSPGRGAAHGPTGAGGRPCGTGGKTPCTNSRLAWCAQRRGAGRPGSGGKSPRTNSPNPGAAGAGARPCRTGGKTPCTNTCPQNGLRRPDDTGRPGGAPLVAPAEAHAPEPARRVPAVMRAPGNRLPPLAGPLVRGGQPAVHLAMTPPSRLAIGVPHATSAP